MVDERFLKTSGAIELINKIRGGSLTEAAAALVLIVVIWQILGVGIEGFVPSQKNVMFFSLTYGLYSKRIILLA